MMWNWSVRRVRSGTTIRSTETRTVGSRMRVFGSDLVMVILGGLGAATWTWGVRRLINVLLAQGERAFERRSCASNGGRDKGPGLDFWC